MTLSSRCRVLGYGTAITCTARDGTLLADDVLFNTRLQQLSEALHAMELCSTVHTGQSTGLQYRRSHYDMLNWPEAESLHLPSKPAVMVRAETSGNEESALPNLDL